MNIEKGHGLNFWSYSFSRSYFSIYIYIYVFVVVVVVLCFQAFLFIFRSMVRACFSRQTGRITRRKSQRSGWPDVAASDRC